MDRAAALAALEILMIEPERVSTLRECSNELRRRFSTVGIESGRSTLSAVVPWIVGKSDDALRIAQAMNQRGGSGASDYFSGRGGRCCASPIFCHDGTPIQPS